VRGVFLSRLALGGIVIAAILTAGWLLYPGLAVIADRTPAFYPAVIATGGVVMLMLACILWIEDRALRHEWMLRAMDLAGLEFLLPESLLQRIIGSIPDPLEWLCQPLWRTRIGHALQAEWIDSSLGTAGSRYLVLLAAAGTCGCLLGMRIGGPLLGFSFALVLPLLPRTLVANRAQAERRRFGEQLPQLLELLSSGMAAGMSLQQAVKFSRDELKEPARTDITKLIVRLELGWTVDRALESLARERNEEGLHLAVEGMILQRQFGGNVVSMLKEIGGLLRERLELEQEVRAISSQGRLSGIVIGALVPASAAFLLAFNPRYIDILFETLVGQALIVLTIILQLAGWAVISRMMAIRV
jgi:tight adherence protein B